MAETVYVTIQQETVNDESVRILSWKVASGSRVEKEQFLCDVETSKAVMEIHAPAAGTIAYRFGVGDEVPIGATICEIVPANIGSGAPAAPLPMETKPARNGAGETYAARSDAPPARFTPLALKIAAECGIDAALFPPGSLVRSNDVLRKAGQLPPEDAPQWPRRRSEPESRPEESIAVAGAALDWADLPRRKILEGKVLSIGQSRSVQSSVTVTCRIARLRAHLERQGLPATALNALIIFETARLIRKHPVFNAVYDRGRIGVYRDVNIGWAIDGGQGLVVPVVKQADEKSTQEIAAILQRQLEAYIENALTPADLFGGTFTLSNLSTEGVHFFHPLISQGQSAILGVGTDLRHREGELLYLTLAFDHQLADGRTAAQFLRELSERLEAYASLDNTQTEPSAAKSELYCALCQRDGKALLEMKAVLLKSEVPAGFVCSLCISGF